MIPSISKNRLQVLLFLVCMICFIPKDTIAQNHKTIYKYSFETTDYANSPVFRKIIKDIFHTKHISHDQQSSILTVYSKEKFNVDELHEKLVNSKIEVLSLINVEKKQINYKPNNI